MVLVIRQSIVSRNKKTVLHVAKLQFRPSIVVPATLNVRCWNNISIFDCGNFATEGIYVTPHHELLLPFICFMHGRCMDLSENHFQVLGFHNATGFFQFGQAFRVCHRWDCAPAH